MADLEKTVTSQDKIITELQIENKELRNRCEELEAECTTLKVENTLLRNDNERMKRILSNNSDNSSLPPSTSRNVPSASGDNHENQEKKKPQST